MSWLDRGGRAAAVVDLPRGITAAPSCIDPVNGATPREPFIYCDRTTTMPWCVFPLRGFVVGARHWQVGSVEGQGVRIEVSMATIVGTSDVRDATLVEVIGYSLTCHGFASTCLLL
jgi:hypothetical protein